MISRQKKLNHSILTCASVILLGSGLYINNAKASEAIGADQALLRAATINSLAGIQAARNSGANLEATNRFGETALMIVSGDRGGELDLVNELIQAGANVKAKSNTGQTALWYSANYKYKDIANALIEAGADPNVVDDTNQTFVEVTATEDDLELVAFAIKMGADLSPAALTSAANNNHTDTVKILLHHGGRLPQGDGITAGGRRLINENIQLHNEYLQASETFVDQDKQTPTDVTRLIMRDFAGHSDFKQEK